MKKVALATSVLLLSGCMDGIGFSTKSSPPDYGPAIDQQSCQDIARKHIEPILLKPRSALFKFGRCMPDTLGARPDLGLPDQSGYAMAFEVDSKDANDLYSGFQYYEFLIYDGKVMRRIRQSPGSRVWERF